MNFNAQEIVALRAARKRIAVFFRLDTDPIVRLWLGFGKINPGINVYDPDGAIYRGFGELLNVPAFNQLLNGAAERVEFQLSGVSGDVLAIASGSDVEQVKGKRTAVGFALMDSNWALLGEVHWFAYYVADFLAMEQQPADESSPIVRTITLSCGTRFTGRRRPALSYFSNQDQQRRFTSDLFCSLVGNYAHEFNKTWPTFS